VFQFQFEAQLGLNLRSNFDPNFVKLGSKLTAKVWGIYCKIIPSEISEKKHNFVSPPPKNSQVDGVSKMVQLAFTKKSSQKKRVFLDHGIERCTLDLGGLTIL
jgi:hypothetical protein